MYLIMKCDELNDQFECDADRTPITLTEDWQKWFTEERPDYCFEVHEFKDGKFECVKDYTEPMERGMALYYWTKEQMYSSAVGKPTVVQRWKDADRGTPIPKRVRKIPKYNDWTEALMTNEEAERSLDCRGAIGWTADNGDWWVYGEYFDQWYNMAI